MNLAAERLRHAVGGAVAWSVGAALPRIMRGALRRNLQGVWLLGDLPDLPEGGLVLAPNHHSWWDGYLAWLLIERLERPAAALMKRDQLARFPFFRRLGALAHDEIRPALRAVKGGSALVVFPEGALGRAGGAGDLQPGALFFGAHARVPVVPVALRVTLRGAPRPEAYVAVGTPLAPDAASMDVLRERLDALLSEVDHALAAAHPEEAPFGARAWLVGRSTTRDDRAWWERVIAERTRSERSS